MTSILWDHYLFHQIVTVLDKISTHKICTTYYHLVGQGGADPPTPEGSGFTVRRSCRFTTDPYKIRELVKTVSPREGFSMIPRRRNDSNARELLHPSLFSRQISSAT